MVFQRRFLKIDTDRKYYNATPESGTDPQWRRPAEQRGGDITVDRCYHLVHTRYQKYVSTKHITVHQYNI